MTAAVLGVMGGSGRLRPAGAGGCARGARRLALGRALRRPADRADRRDQGGVPGPPRPRPSALAVGDQLPRQHRRPEAGRRHRPRLALGLRLVPRRAASRPVRARRPVRRPDAWARRPRSSATAASPTSRSPTRSGRTCRRASRTRPRPRTSRCIAAAPTSAWRGRNSPRWPNPRAYKAQGFDVIGMTNMPEAKLAREAEITYATIAMVTDYDCWHPGHDAVDVASVVAVARANADKAARLVARLARDFPAEREPCPAGSHRALDGAIMTAPRRPRSGAAGQARRRGGARAQRLEQRPFPFRRRLPSRRRTRLPAGRRTRSANIMRSATISRKTAETDIAVSSPSTAPARSRSPPGSASSTTCSTYSPGTPCSTSR